MKKLILCLMLIIFINTFLFSNEDEPTEISQNEKLTELYINWISGELNMAGAGFRYERMLNSKFSMGTIVYFQFYGIVSIGDLGIDFTTRFYPAGKIFYIGVDIGFHFVIRSIFGWENLGFAITPEFGVKIDVGKPGGFFIDIGIKTPQVIGWDGYSTAIVPYIGFGGSL